MLKTLLHRLPLILAGLLAAVLLWLWAAPPNLIRVGAGYAAKIVCSSVFISGRDAHRVLQDDVQSHGHPLLRLMRVSVDHEQRVVRAGLFGFAGGGLAVARDGTGCATVPDGDLARARAHAAPAVAAAPPRPGRWPEGDEVGEVGDAAPALAALLADPALAGPGMRALLVLHRGRIVAERYGDGFDATTPLLGWSMTKTVTAALVGTLVRDGRIDVERDALFPGWDGDGRRAIAMAQLLSMSSGLSFNEDYGSVTDVTRMLYLEPDMAAFAGQQPLAQPVGSVFNYSSGSSVLLARLWQDAVPGGAALAWPRRALFDPLGMRSAVLEADARGTFVGSSYLYASGRDWARFALLLLQDGQWNGQPLLPAGWVARMRAPSPVAPTDYTQGQMWLHGPRAGTPEGQNPDAGFQLPADTVWMNGHDGQAIALVPSRQLAVLRLGLTPVKLQHKPQRLVQAVLRTLP
jgi:CubicO group peptidase (beta-lactamase class C family)